MPKPPLAPPDDLALRFPEAFLALHVTEPEQGETLPVRLLCSMQPVSQALPGNTCFDAKQA